MTLLERLDERWEKMNGAAAPKIDRILKERREAADEIRRLRSALQMMVDHMFGPCASDMSRVEIEVLARSALKPLT